MPRIDISLEYLRKKQQVRFHNLFDQLDKMRIRPLSAVADALSASSPIPDIDSDRLFIIESIAAENRILLASLECAETPDEVMSINPWAPIEALASEAYSSPCGL